MLKYPTNIYVYILLCSNGKFYTDYSTQMHIALKEHWAGRGSRYTKAFPPTSLKFWQKMESEAAAEARVREIRGWSHERKGQLIRWGS